jgi:hypothetical protein
MTSNLTLADIALNVTTNQSSPYLSNMIMFNVIVVWVLYIVGMLFVIYMIKKHFKDLREKKRIAEEAYKEVYE